MGSPETSPPLHRVTIGRTRETRGPDAFERGFAAIIAAIVASIAVGYGMQAARAVQTLEAVSLASTPRIDAIVHRAVHGSWPRAGDATITAGIVHGSYVRQLSLDADGAITADMRLGNAATPPGASRAGNTLHGLLSFRPELLGARDASSITYVCGYAKPVADARAVSGSNRTTLPRQYLPPFCR